MSDLTGQEIKETYKDLLHMNNGNTGVTSDLSRVFDGEGTGSSLYLSDTEASVMGDFGIGTTTPDANLHIEVDSGPIDSGNDRSGAVLRLAHNAEWNSAYGDGGSNPDFLGGIEFKTSDASGGTGVRTAIKTTVDHYANLNSLAFYTAPASNSPIEERLRIDSAGHCGIGTTSPESRLHVHGDLTFTGSTSGNQGTRARILHTSGAAANGEDSKNDGGLILQSNNNGTYVDGLTIDHNGHCGIGTTEPSGGKVTGKALDITDSVASILRLNRSGGADYSILTNAGQLQFYNNNLDSASLSIKDGNVGIGTTSPIFALDVADQVSLSLGANENNERENLTNKSSRVGGIHYDNGKKPVNMMMHYCSATENNLYFGWGTSAMVCPTKIVFGTASTTNISSAYSSANQRMVIDGSGNVGINTGAPEQKLFIKDGSLGTDGDGYIIQKKSASNTTGEYGVIHRTGYYQANTGNHYGRVRINSTYDSSTNAANLKFYTAPSGANSSRLAFTIGSNGTVSCEYGLEVQGNINAGSASSAVKNFKIDHPLPEKSETHDLYHVSIEGPTADLIYRGVTKLENGIAEINIDSASRMTEGTFEALCTNVQCFTTNETSWDLTRGKVTGNILKIECQDPNCTDEISWMVIGERKDKSMLEHERTDDNGRLVPEWEKPKPEPEPEYEMIEPEEVVTEEPVAEEAPVEEQVSIGASISGESLTEVSDARAEEL